MLQARQRQVHLAVVALRFFHWNSRPPNAPQKRDASVLRHESEAAISTLLQDSLSPTVGNRSNCRPVDIILRGGIRDYIATAPAPPPTNTGNHQHYVECKGPKHKTAIVDLKRSTSVPARANLPNPWARECRNKCAVDWMQSKNGELIAVGVGESRGSPSPRNGAATEYPRSKRPSQRSPTPLSTPGLPPLGRGRTC